MKQFLIIISILSLLIGYNQNIHSANFEDTGSSLFEISEPNEDIALSDNEVSEEEIDSLDSEVAIIEDTASISTVTYPSTDELLITADLYRIDDTSDFMILFHRAGWSRGEYIDTALKFNALGYNVLAVDQRSGGQINGIKNETYLRALAKGYSTTYVAAGRDVEASIEYVRDELKCNSISILGSSYSATLVLVIAQDYEAVIEAIICFSPGEHFLWKGEKIRQVVDELTLPVFVTSKKTEIAKLETLFGYIGSEIKIQHKPEKSGRHGSEALWESFDESTAHWDAITKFLDDVNSQN